MTDVMVAALSFSKADLTPSERALEEERLRLVRGLIQGLSDETRAMLSRELSVATEARDARPTDIIAAIVDQIAPGQTVTAAKLRKDVADRSVIAAPKDVYNSIGYLARTGKLTRLGYGRYSVNGVEIETSDDLGGEKTRDEDLSDGN